MRPREDAASHSGLVLAALEYDFLAIGAGSSGELAAAKLIAGIGTLPRG